MKIGILGFLILVFCSNGMASAITNQEMNEYLSDYDSSLEQEAVELNNSGYRFNDPQKAATDFQNPAPYFALKFETGLLSKFIRNFYDSYFRSKNLVMSDVTSRSLAQKISTVTQCFGLDEAVFVGLLMQESQFKTDWLQESGSGITQMTTSGINEIDDQFGKRGLAQADEEMIAAVGNVIQKCIEPKMLNGKKFSPLYKRPGVKGGEASRAEVSKDVDVALIYGAALLKIQVVRVRHKLGSNAPWAMVYHAALKAYNANDAYKNATKNGKKVRVQIKEVYPGEVLDYSRKLVEYSKSVKSS